MGIRKDSTGNEVSENVPDRATHAALVDVTANKSVRLVEECAGNVLPVTLCSDGTHLYALLAADAVPLRDAFGEIAQAAGVLYKVAADLTLVDRLHSPKAVGAACAADGAASTLFMLRAYSKTGDTDVQLYDRSGTAIDMGTCRRGDTNPGKQGSGCVCSCFPHLQPSLSPPCSLPHTDSVCERPVQARAAHVDCSSAEHDGDVCVREHFGHRHARSLCGCTQGRQHRQRDRVVH